MAEKKTPINVEEITRLDTAPEFFVDGYKGVIIANGVVKLNFFTRLFDPSANKTIPVAALRMVTSVEALSGIRDALNTLFADLEKQNIVQRVEGADDKTS
jgi:hypothetical protein